MSIQPVNPTNIPVLTEIVPPPPGFKPKKVALSDPPPVKAPETVVPTAKEEISIDALLSMFKESILDDLKQKVDSQLASQLEFIVPKLTEMIQKEISKVVHQEIERILTESIELEQQKLHTRKST